MSKIIPLIPECSEELKQKIVDKINEIERTKMCYHFCNGKAIDLEVKNITKITIERIAIGNSNDILTNGVISVRCPECKEVADIITITESDLKKEDKILSDVLSKQEKCLERTEVIKKIGKVENWSMWVPPNDKFLQSEPHSVFSLRGKMISSVDPEEWVDVGGRIGVLDLRNKVCETTDGTKFVLGTPAKNFFNSIAYQNKPKVGESKEDSTEKVCVVLERQEKILSKK